MTLPRIYTKATNVELTAHHENLILERLAPLARWLISEEQVRIDVNIRRTHSHLTGDTYLVLVKVTTPTERYVAASAKHHLGRALSAAREMLRNSISRGASVADRGMRRARQSDFDEYLVTDRSL